MQASSGLAITALRRVRLHTLWPGMRSQQRPEWEPRYEVAGWEDKHLNRSRVFSSLGRVPQQPCREREIEV